MQPARIPLLIIQGSTLRDTLRVMQPKFVYRPITEISATAPVRLTCEHDLTSDWLAWIQDTRQMPELNRTPRREKAHRVEFIDSNTLEINAISATGRAPEGGQLIYQPPVDLAGAVARMQIRAEPQGAVLIELTTENSGLTITGPGTIERLISAADTSAITWAKAVYDLEVEYADGTVQRYFEGPVTVSPEVTR